MLYNNPHAQLSQLLLPAGPAPAADSTAAARHGGLSAASWQRSDYYICHCVCWCAPRHSACSTCWAAPGALLAQQSGRLPGFLSLLLRAAVDEGLRYDSRFAFASEPGLRCLVDAAALYRRRSAGSDKNLVAQTPAQTKEVQVCIDIFTVIHEANENQETKCCITCVNF